MAWYDRLLAVAESALERANEALEAVVEATAPEPARRPDREPPPQPRPRRRARPRSTRQRLTELEADREADRRRIANLEAENQNLRIVLNRETRRRERAEETARRRRERPEVIYPIPIAGRKRPPKAWLVAQNLSRDEAMAHFDDFVWVPDKAKAVLQVGPRDYRLFVDPYYFAAGRRLP